jgi:hypothetical protein
MLQKTKTRRTTDRKRETTNDEEKHRTPTELKRSCQLPSRDGRRNELEKGAQGTLPFQTQSGTLARESVFACVQIKYISKSKKWIEGSLFGTYVPFRLLILMNSMWKRAIWSSITSMSHRPLPTKSLTFFLDLNLYFDETFKHRTGRHNNPFLCLKCISGKSGDAVELVPRQIVKALIPPDFIRGGLPDLTTFKC